MAIEALSAAIWMLAAAVVPMEAAAATVTFAPPRVRLWCATLITWLPESLARACSCVVPPSIRFAPLNTALDVTVVI